MKCLCIGICQLGALVKILEKSTIFTSFYDNIVYYPVYDISESKMAEILEKEVPSSDLIISQPVSDNYKNNEIFSSKKLREVANKQNKKHLIMANCYFTGYDPTPFQITDNDGNIIHSDGISYFPSMCVDSLIAQNVDRACIEWCNIDCYSNKELDINLRYTITELKNRENKIFDNDFAADIIISDYIENFFLHKHLFHTYNHPTNIIIIELFNRLMKKIELPPDSVILDQELLGSFSIPPPPSVYYGSHITFEYPKFILYDKPYTTKEAMKILSEKISKVSPEFHCRWKSSILWSRKKISDSF